MKCTFLESWKAAITALGVGALAAFDFRIKDYRQATDIDQISLADDRHLVQLLPLLDDDQQRLLVLMVSCRNPLLARELSLRSGKVDIDRLTLLPREMQQIATRLIAACFKEGKYQKDREGRLDPVA